MWPLAELSVGLWTVLVTVGSGNENLGSIRDGNFLISVTESSLCCVMLWGLQIAIEILPLQFKKLKF
jgi:hypothetical protein